MNDELFKQILSDDPILRALDKKAQERRLNKIFSEQTKRDAIAQFKTWCEDHKYSIMYIFTVLKKWQEADPKYIDITYFRDSHNFIQCGWDFHALGRLVDPDDPTASKLYGVLDTGKAATISPECSSSLAVTTIFDPYQYDDLSDIFIDNLWSGERVKNELESFEQDFMKFGEDIKQYLKEELGVERECLLVV